MRIQHSQRIVSVLLALVWAGTSSFGQGTPAPSQFSGHEVGADHHLLTCDQSAD